VKKLDDVPPSKISVKPPPLKNNLFFNSTNNHIKNIDNF
jgi:hypothetical protein